LLQIGHPDKSVNYFTASVKHDPQFVPGWFYLGESRRLSGQREQAITAYEACLKLNPNHGRALALLPATRN
jgi:predicted TPR repeat methyltransferase